MERKRVKAKIVKFCFAKGPWEYNFIWSRAPEESSCPTWLCSAPKCAELQQWPQGSKVNEWWRESIHRIKVAVRVMGLEVPSSRSGLFAHGLLLVRLLPPAFKRSQTLIQYHLCQSSHSITGMWLKYKTMVFPPPYVSVSGALIKLFLLTEFFSLHTEHINWVFHKDGPPLWYSVTQIQCHEQTRPSYSFTTSSDRSENLFSQNICKWER